MGRGAFGLLCRTGQGSPGDPLLKGVLATFANPVRLEDLAQRAELRAPAGCGPVRRRTGWCCPGGSVPGPPAWC